jgi:hypothetical protein
MVKTFVLRGDVVCYSPAVTQPSSNRVRQRMCFLLRLCLGLADARRLHREHPRDWKAARQAIHEKWVKQKKWNSNSTPSNGALVLLALLYGEGDFYKTLQYAMALGYDADCNAATAGAVLGTRLGFRHLAALPQSKMPDRYVNKTRPSLPAQCKVSEQAETLMRVCERVILANGGERIEVNGQPGYRVRLQPPRLIEPLLVSSGSEPSAPTR